MRCSTAQTAGRALVWPVPKVASVPSVLVSGGTWSVPVTVAPAGANPEVAVDAAGLNRLPGRSGAGRCCDLYAT